MTYLLLPLNALFEVPLEYSMTQMKENSFSAIFRKKYSSGNYEIKEIERMHKTLNLFQVKMLKLTYFRVKKKKKKYHFNCKKLEKCIICSFMKNKNGSLDLCHFVRGNILHEKNLASCSNV